MAMQIKLIVVFVVDQDGGSNLHVVFQSCLHMKTQVLSNKFMEALKTSPEVEGKTTNHIHLFFNFK